LKGDNGTDSYPNHPLISKEIRNQPVSEKIKELQKQIREKNMK
jgi:hypothetical protein